MSTKYHINVKDTLSRFHPVPKLNFLEADGCLGCIECVKRESCVYDVYRERVFDPCQIIDSGDVLCISCMRCVQECKKNILSHIRNPEFDNLGDEYWTPEIISSIWQQSTTGKIPISGAGYGGPFSGPGFDRMWTDMSEIVRPTRDGIHGREYISTVIELGRRPDSLEFDNKGKLLTKIPHFTNIPIPIVLDLPECHFINEAVLQATIQAAGKLHTYAVIPFQYAVKCSDRYKKQIIVKFNPSSDSFSKLKGFKIVELEYSKSNLKSINKIKSLNPDIIISIRIKVDEHTIKRVEELAKGCGEIIHLQMNHNGQGFGKYKNNFTTKLIKEIHFNLTNKSLRDQVTLLTTGGIAMAEHMAKIITCGVDGVGLDRAILASLECRLCRDCAKMKNCPVKIDDIYVEWGAQRIINLAGAWHSQLIEVMGAMGLREARRLRGELGRVMFFEDLEKDNFAPVFGKRTRSMIASIKDAKQLLKNKQGSNNTDIKNNFPAYKNLASSCPSRYRNQMGPYKVIRTSSCIACGKCEEICKYGVHKKAGNKMLTPKSEFCRGKEICKSNSKYCVDHCPMNALKVGQNPLWEAFGDQRWPAELLVSTWLQSETGYPPEQPFEYKTGASCGGFDRININIKDKAREKAFKPKDVDLSIQLNRRNDGRPRVTIGIPFYGGGMSYGSISLATMVARAKAYKAFNSFTCTGEGGYPDELKPYDNYVITQVATGLFGVKEETIQRVRIIELKYAQGAKPGLGGHLLGDKVTPEVAKMREALESSSLFSPFPFHSVYSVEDHKKHVDWIKQINTKALVSVKVSGASDVDMVAIGSFYADAHIIHLDGSYGGTGAAPDIAKKNIAMPIEYAIPKVHNFLVEEGVRDKMTIIASGGIRTAWDVAKVIALGANGAVLGTAETVALECIRCSVCESGRGCPRGIATTDPELSRHYGEEWATQRLINLFHSWAVQLQNICWQLGLKRIEDLVGRSDLLMHLDYDNK